MGFEEVSPSDFSRAGQELASQFTLYANNLVDNLNFQNGDTAEDIQRKIDSLSLDLIRKDFDTEEDKLRFWKPYITLLQASINFELGITDEYQLNKIRNVI